MKKYVQIVFQLSACVMTLLASQRSGALNSGNYLFGGGIYYANGLGQACYFSSWNDYLYSGGNSNLTGVSMLSAWPATVTVAGPCHPDERASLQKQIDQAIASGATELVLQPRQYRLVCADRSQDYCLNITGARNFRLRGTKDKTRLVVATSRSGALSISNSTNIEIQGLQIDYETPPFTQGRITAVSATSITFRVDPGFPEPSDPIFSQDLFGIAGSIRIGFVHEGLGFKMKGHEGSYLSILRQPTSLGNRTWQVSVTQHGTNASVGDGFSMGPRTSFGFFVYQNTNVRFSQVSVFTAPSLAFAVVGNRGAIQFEEINVRILPSSGRLLSTVADAIHAQNNAAQIVLKDSYIEGMGDDAFNTYSTGQKITNVSGNELVIETPYLDYIKGDIIQVLNPDRSIARLGAGGEAVVQAVRREDAQHVRLTFNKAVPSVHVGDSAYNVNHAAPGSVIWKNKFGPFRGLIRLRSANGRIADNSFADLRNAGIYFSTDQIWNEGPMVGVPYYSGNIVTGGTLKIYGPGSVLGSYASGPDVQTSLVEANLNSAILLDPSVFQASTYSGLNADLKSMDYYQLQTHWIARGINEGRKASKMFHSVQYLNRYQDLRQAYGSTNYLQALIHYVVYGISERRIGD